VTNFDSEIQHNLSFCFTKAKYLLCTKYTSSSSIVFSSIIILTLEHYY